jgi:hypothetical protein
MAKTETTPNPTTKMHEKKLVEKSNDQGEQSYEKPTVIRRNDNAVRNNQGYI